MLDNKFSAFARRGIKAILELESILGTIHLKIMPNKIDSNVM
jgi:hypothetical protein